MRMRMRMTMNNAMLNNWLKRQLNNWFEKIDQTTSFEEQI